MGVQLLPSVRDCASVHATPVGFAGSTQQWPLPVEHSPVLVVPSFQVAVTLWGDSWLTTTWVIHLPSGISGHWIAKGSSSSSEALGWSGGTRCRTLDDAIASGAVPPPAITRSAVSLASRSEASDGSLIRRVAMLSLGPPPDCWIVWASSWARMRRPPAVPGSYWPVPKTMWFPTVYASAFTARADRAAMESV